MSSPPALSRSEVRNWTEQRFYDRGDNYFQQGRILRPRREGRTLKAECQGSQPSPYHVEAELDEGGIAAAECSCPMGGGGYCKHVVALLLTWVESPDKFESQAPLEATLREQSPDTLVRMILTMVDRHPDLERLARHSAAAGDTLDPEKLRRQIQSVFKDMGHGHDNHDRDPHSVVQQVADDLQPFFNRAEKYREHGRFHDAATGYRLLVEETIDHHENFYDEEGELTSRVAEATRELGEILGEVEDDPDLRETILRTLFQTYAWDVDLGGHGVGDWAHDAILEHATRDERQRVAEWVRDRIPNTAESLGRDRSVLVIGKDSGSSWHNDWKRETLGGFLLDLLADSLDDEEYLQICRQTGRMTDLIERLLERDRLDEALDAAHEASDYEVYQLTAPFAEHGAEDALYDLVLNRLDDETDRRLVAWLRDAAVDRNDPDRALALSRRLFWTETSESAYERLRATAQRLDRWDEVQAELHEELRTKGNYALLTRLHLADGNVEAALETLPKADATFSRSSNRSPLPLQVARAAEEEHPEEAIRIYTERGRSLIAERGRDNYREAAKLFKRVKTLFERTQPGVCPDVLDTLYDDELHRLPAARDEFEKAGLL